MIDVKELMIGNLVMGHYEDDETNAKCQVLCKVLCIDSIGTSHNYPLWVESIGEKIDVESFNDFTPIPLTEDWLIRFGFEKIDAPDPVGRDTYKMDTENFLLVIALTKDRDNLTCIRMGSGNNAIAFREGRMCFAHQLQNLYFALTGEELKLIQ